MNSARRLAAAEIKEPTRGGTSLARERERERERERRNSGHFGTFYFLGTSGTNPLTRAYLT